jgi:hypothetical protein
MARICSKCNYYDADGNQDTCPNCQAPLRFTLLLPAGASLDPPSAAGSETVGIPRANRRGSSTLAGTPGSFFDLLEMGFRHRRVLSLVAVPVLLLLSLGFGINLTGPSLQDKFDRLKVGMDVDEVRAIMEPPTHHRHRFGRPLSMFTDFPERGPVTLVWEENGATVTLEFLNGELVSKSRRPPE